MARAPDGHFLGWSPGKQTTEGGPGMAFRLWPGQDLVLQLHLVPTGKAESVQPRIGFYFTDAPPTVRFEATRCRLGRRLSWRQRWPS